MHELRVTSRPLYAAITDEGDILAIVPSRDMVIIYDLSGDAPEVLQVIKLTGTPRALTLGPGGSVLAIAYNNQIEVCEVGRDVGPQQRRTIRCQGIESLRFSNDGLTLLGSSLVFNCPKLLIIEIPFSLDMPEDLSFQEACAHHWASEIFVPRTLETFSHSSLIQGGPSLFSKQWIVGYDTTVKAFRLSDIEHCPSGPINFVGPGIDGIKEEPAPETVPAINKTGQILAAGFKGSGVWIYGTPQSLEQPMSIQHRRTNTGRGPELIQQWKKSKRRTNSQRLRKVLHGPRCLIYGHQLTPENYDTVDIRWVCDVANEKAPDRLALLQKTSPLASDDADSDYETRIALFDFQRWHKNGATESITLEIGKSSHIFLPDPSIGQLSEISSLTMPLTPSITEADLLSAGPSRNQPVIPHESDADNWVQPPPPYSAEDPNEPPLDNFSTLPPFSLSNGPMISDTPYDNHDWDIGQVPRSSTTLDVPSYAASVASGAQSPRPPATPTRSARSPARSLLQLEVHTPEPNGVRQPNIFDLEAFPYRQRREARQVCRRPDSE
ncbi:mitochondrial 5-aminolevulinate synthase [Ascosphaera pollenicola]|nr:mitochondrial 5-aminolevulinate synthase [Ascosphaera pollenicola]